MKMIKLYVRLAELAVQHSNCIASNNTEWQDRSQTEIEKLVKDYMPSGSGIDSGTKFDFDATMRHAGACLVFTTAFHHMDDQGGYDGWTEHVLTVRPSLASGFSLGISGKNRNEIKEYLHEVYASVLNDEDWSLREAYLRAVEVTPSIKIESHWPDQCTQKWTIGKPIACGVEFSSFKDAVRFLYDAGRLN